MERKKNLANQTKKFILYFYNVRKYIISFIIRDFGNNKQYHLHNILQSIFINDERALSLLNFCKCKLRKLKDLLKLK
jgi:hypothetical protein